MLLLAIETSCDETSVAVLRDGCVFANAVSSQIKLHEEYGGVMFPESRKIVIGDGAMTIEYAYAKTEIDVELDETVFERP